MKDSDLKKCLIIKNSRSTHKSRASRLSKILEDYFPATKIKTVDITGLKRSEIEEILQAHGQELDSDTLLAIAGGDGTVSTVVSILLGSPHLPKTARRAAILPLWGGNANDFAYMVNGEASGSKLRLALNDGKVVPIHPLSVDMESFGLVSHKLAVCYASFGVSAYVAQAVNQPSYRRLPLYRLTGARTAIEMASALKVFLFARPFTADIGGQNTAMYDLLLANGSRFAKLDLLPLNINDKVFMEVAVEHKISGLFLYLAQIFKWRGQEFSSKSEKSLTVHDPTWAQLDGEVTQIPAHTEVNVSLHPEPFYVLSTRLQALK